MNPIPHAVLFPHRHPEIELLLCCARTRMEPGTIERVSQLLKEEIDWHYLSQFAFHHGVLPLLSWNLNNFYADDVPKAMLNHLKDACRIIVQWNLYLTSELLRLLKLFQDAGIRAIPFKGPILAVVAYGNPLLRHFGDLDIFVPREDILKAKEMLVAKGYYPKYKFTTSEEAAYLRSHHDYKFVRATDRVAIDIQWGITQWSFAFPIDFEDIWKRRESASLAGTMVFNLSLDDALLILCVHGTKHRWEQLRWICDIAELINTHQQRIDWECLMKEARAQGGDRMLRLGLYLAHSLLNATLPERILRRIHEDPQMKILVNDVNESLFGDPARPVKFHQERPFFYLRTRERLRDKAALFWRYFPGYFLRAVARMRKNLRLVSSPRSLLLVIPSFNLFG